jgi:AcrR family transcriptional regulator
VTEETIRRGRPPEAERGRRRQQALEAALAEIVERGYEAVSMLDVARRAHCSKQSLYGWFGNKSGLIENLILDQSRRTNDAVGQALRSDARPQEVLTRIATGLLNLLLGPNSVALNRAAMTAPELADSLLRHGRHTTGPLIESYLRSLHDTGQITAPDPVAAFRVFYGLVIQDSQIRVLLGEHPPTRSQREQQATKAVRDFLELHGR